MPDRTDQTGLTETDLMADLAASRLDGPDGAPQRTRRSWLAVLAAAFLALGALTIFQLALGSSPSTAYQEDRPVASPSPSEESTAAASDDSATAPAPEPSSAPSDAAPTTQAAAEPSEPPAASAPAEQPAQAPQKPAPNADQGRSSSDDGTQAPAPAPAPPPAPAPAPAPAVTTQAPAPTTQAPAPAPATQAPAPEPTCRHWYWMGLAQHDGKTMNKYNVEGEIYYLPLSAPHALTVCW